MVRNYYRTTEIISSGQEELDYSMNIVDYLLRKNGYSNPRDHVSKGNKKKTNTNVNRPISFISDRVSNQVRSYYRKLKLQAHIVFKPGSKLRRQFCNSRPHDSWRCVVTNNKTCVVGPDTPNNTCSTKNLVYIITCEHCDKRYIGETERTLHDRMLEHRRAATNPEKHPNNALAKHYISEHETIAPLLKYRVLKSHVTRGAEAGGILGYPPLFWTYTPQFLGWPKMEGRRGGKKK